MSGQRVLVTGGAGFIGSNIVDALLNEGEYVVRVLDSFATGLRENLAHCLADIELVEGDIRDLETVEQAVEGVDAILHHAALPSVPRSIRAPVTTNDVNAGGTLKMLSAAAKAGVSRMVFASSSSVYGQSEVLPKSETMTSNPVSPYAVSKLAAEGYCRVFHELYGLETVVFRYFNVFGARQDPRSQYAGVIAKFCQGALSGVGYTVDGDGRQSRDFCHVDNVVKANLLALSAPAVDGMPTNIACGDRVTLLEMVAILNELVGHDLPVVHGEPRPGDVAHSQADIERARAVLGYEPAVRFREGLARTFEWYVAAAPPVDGRRKST